jgi:hypothetical protein
MILITAARLLKVEFSSKDSPNIIVLLSLHLILADKSKPVFWFVANKSRPDLFTTPEWIMIT